MREDWTRVQECMFMLVLCAIAVLAIALAYSI